MNAARHHRPVRSWVRRGGRITPAQRRALQSLWPRYGLAGGGPLDLDRVFGRHAPRTLEIGFGDGTALLAMAAARPGRDHLGVEVHEPGIGRLLLGIEAAGLANVRVLRGDATEVLERRIPEAALDEVILWFPDPWPKKRHHKRRLVQPGFVALVASRLAPGGRFLLATDWREYAEHMLRVLDAEPLLENVARAAPSAAAPGDAPDDPRDRSRERAWASRPALRPATRFERRGARLGHRVRDFEFVRR